MTKLTTIPLILILLIINTANGTPESNRVVRCFFQNLGGCSNANGSCRRFCIDKGCNLAQPDFCERQGFPANRRRELYTNQEEYEAATAGTTTTTDTETTDLDCDHGIDFNMTNLVIPPECMSQSYDLKLVVAEGHLFLSAVPSPSSSSSSCPSLVASTVYEDGQHPTKQLASIGPELVEQIQQKALYLATLELNTIKGAYQNAVATTATDNDTWHLMENNCSVFVMSMLQQLGINYDSDVIRLFVRAELMQSNTIMTMVGQAMTTAGAGHDNEGYSHRLLRGTDVRLLRKLMGEQEMVDHVIDRNIKHFQTYMNIGSK